MSARVPYVVRVRFLGITSIFVDAAHDEEAKREALKVYHTKHLRTDTAQRCSEMYDVVSDPIVDVKALFPEPHWNEEDTDA
jgi:hypothetical protein